ncbi:hypothetical protein [uncultured Roseovarius sp.]|uniref:hypothetical protein n=1 Tax=uncultured Roseovarius sp. TaxID=293344 RepID=UPI00262EC019|nr:hypothetical protein [uncultured Roseovarius sp.]
MAIARVNPAGCWQLLGLYPLGKGTCIMVVAMVAALVVNPVTTIGMVLMAMMLVTMMSGSWTMVLCVPRFGSVVIISSRDVIVSVFVFGNRGSDDCYRSNTAKDLEQIVF